MKSNNEILVLDYDAGNLWSVKSALEHLGFAVIISKDASDIKSFSKILLPGVGNYGECSRKLIFNGMADELNKIINSDATIIGICVGMQLLFDGSEESPLDKGLGLIPGYLKKLSFDVDHRVPHVGFSSVTLNKTINSVKTVADYYFTHSYGVELSKEYSADDIGYFTHGNKTYIGLIHRKNLWGLQFHPEKSQSNGLNLLKTILSS